jgi:hypothetical protein
MEPEVDQQIQIFLAQPYLKENQDFLYLNIGIGLVKFAKLPPG